MKKIVFIITDYGSFNNFLGETAISFLKKGIQVHLISSSVRVIDIEDKFDYEKNGLKIHTVDFPRGFNLLNHFYASKKIHKIVNSINPDLVSIHFTTGVFTTTFYKRLKFKTIATIHGLGYPVVQGVKKLLFKNVERHAISRVDEVWVLNEVDLITINKDFHDVKVFKIPTKGLGCDLKKFNPKIFSEDFRSGLRQSLGIDNTDFVIGFTGRFVHFKGFDKVVRSLKILQEKEFFNIKLLLIGGFDVAHSSGLTNEELEWATSNESIVNVGFSSSVQDFLSITDLFVFPSEKEGMPVCIIESLAMQVPVITANARGCNDLIENGVNGILLKENTPDEIAKEIIYLRNNKDVYDQMKVNISVDRCLMDRQLFVSHQFESLFLSTNS